MTNDNLIVRLRTYFAERSLLKSLKTYSASEFQITPLTVEYLLEPTPKERLLVDIAGMTVPSKPIIFDAVTDKHWSRRPKRRAEEEPPFSGASTVPDHSVISLPLPAPQPIGRTTLEDVQQLYGLTSDRPIPESTSGEQFAFYEPCLDRYFGLGPPLYVYETDDEVPLIRIASCNLQRPGFLDAYGKYVVGTGFLQRCNRLDKKPHIVFRAPTATGLDIAYFELLESGEWSEVPPFDVQGVIPAKPGRLYTRRVKHTSVAGSGSDK